ncbi:MAG: hypothetical protein WB760_08255 [Xanthobacteraceae bacterium]
MTGFQATGNLKKSLIDLAYCEIPPRRSPTFSRGEPQKIALILAHQRLEQIEDKNVMSALSNCAIKYANVEPTDADAMARQLYTHPEKLRLPRGTFAAYVRDLTTEPIVLKVTPVDFSKYETFFDPEEPLHRMANPDSQIATEPPEHASTALDDSHAGEHAEGVDPPHAPAAPADSPANEPVHHKAELDRRAAAPPAEQASAPSNDPHAGDHAKPADKWGNE